VLGAGGARKLQPGELEASAGGAWKASKRGAWRFGFWPMEVDSQGGVLEIEELVTFAS